MIIQKHAFRKISGLRRESGDGWEGTWSGMDMPDFLIRTRDDDDSIDEA